MNIRIMTNNQWKNDNNTDFWKERGLDCSAEVREAGFARLYLDLKPDIIGMQEVSPLMLDVLLRETQALGLNYAAIWGRDTPILYRPDRFELVDTSFLVYPRAVPGLEGEFNNSDTKSYCAAVFRCKENGRLFTFMTTHIWWMSDDPASSYYRNGSNAARVHQIGTAIDAIDGYATKYDAPQVLVGDLNTPYASDPINAAFSRGFKHAHDIAAEYADETNGHHPLGPAVIEPYTPRGFKDGIDHILVRNAPEGFVRRFERTMPESYLLLSDHAPAWIDAVI